MLTRFQEKKIQEDITQFVKDTGCEFRTAHRFDSKRLKYAIEITSVDLGLQNQEKKHIG